MSMGADAWGHATRRLVPFAVAFIAMLVFGIMNRDLAFRGDAHETWEVAKSLFSAESSYRSFVEYRGFVVFVLCAGIYKVSTLLAVDDIATFRVFSALLFAALTTISLPFLFSRLLGRQISVLRTIIFAGAVFYFFRGYFLYPSIDYFALFFLVLALNRVLAPGQRPGVSFGLAGLLMAAAILSRSNYVVCLPFLVALGWMQARAGAVKPRQFAFGMAWFAAALLVMFVANHGYVEYRSQAAGPVKTDGMRVLNAQLTTGLKLQKIEWSIDPSYEGMVTFVEPTGRAVLKEEGIHGWLTAPRYLELVAARPVDFAGIYARHLFNGLDISYPSIYVDDVRRSRLLFSLFNYTLIFLGLLVAAKVLFGPRRSAQGTVGLACVVVPSLFCIPFPVEPRFFLAVVVALHGCAVFGSGLSLSELRSAAGKRDVFFKVMLYAAFLAACFAVSARTFAQIEGEALPLHFP